MIKSTITFCMIVFALVLLHQQHASAQLTRRTGQWVAGKVLKKAGAEVVESATKQVAKKASRHALQNASKTTARGFVGEGIKTAGKKVGKEVLDNAVIAANRLTAQNARRLALIEKDLVASGKSPQVMELLANHSAADLVMNWLWRHKGKIATGAVLSTLLANPDAVLGASGDFAEKIIESSGEHIAQPLILEATKPLISQTSMGLTIGVVVVSLSIGFVIVKTFSKKGGRHEHSSTKSTSLAR